MHSVNLLLEPRVVRNENYTEQTVKPVKVKPQIRSSRDISIFDDEELTGVCSERLR